MKKKLMTLMLTVVLGASATNVFSCGIKPTSDAFKVDAKIDNDKIVEPDMFSTTGTSLVGVAQELLELLTYTKDKYTSAKDNNNALNFFGQEALYNYSIEGLKDSVQVENWSNFYNLLNGPDNADTYVSSAEFNLGDNYANYNSKTKSEGDYTNYFKTFAIKKDATGNISVADVPKIDDLASLDETVDQDPDIALFKTNYADDLMLMGKWNNDPKSYTIEAIDNPPSVVDIDSETPPIFYLNNSDNTTFDSNVVYYRSIASFEFDLTITNGKESYTVALTIGGLLEKFALFASALNMLILPVSYTFDNPNDAYDNNTGILKNITVDVKSIS